VNDFFVIFPRNLVGSEFVSGEGAELNLKHFIFTGQLSPVHLVMSFIIRREGQNQNHPQGQGAAEVVVYLPG